MNIKFIKFVYSMGRTSESTFERLRKDFGEYPPLPLSVQREDNQFVIIEPTGLGKYFYHIDTAVKFSSEIYAAERMDSVAFECITETKVALEKFKEEIKSLEAATGGGRAFKIISAAGFKAVKAIMIWRMAKALLRRDKEVAVLGSFLPTSDSGGSLMIGKSDPKQREALISHEHIHFLQHIDNERHEKRIIDPAKYLNKNRLESRFILYLLEKKEVEARLHDMVVSYYRKVGSLPTSLDGFLALLSGESRCGWIIRGVIELKGGAIGNQIIDFTSRDESSSEQFEAILISLEDFNITYRFISEVLYTMYGNLIRYYGDQEMSKLIIDSVQRPSLYEEMYKPSKLKSV